MKANNPYVDGSYYESTYAVNKMSFDVATKWSTNYLKVVIDIFPKILEMKDSQLLEIGSSFGGFVNSLNLEGFNKVIASDVSNRVVSKELKNKQLAINLLETNKQNEKYDVVFAFDVMEHIDDSQKAVQSVLSLLEEKGYFIFSVPFPIKKHLVDSFHTNMQFPNFYTNLLRQSGYRLVAMENVSFVPFVWRLKIPMYVKFIVNNPMFISETFFVFQKI